MQIGRYKTTRKRDEGGKGRKVKRKKRENMKVRRREMQEWREKE